MGKAARSVLVIISHDALEMEVVRVKIWEKCTVGLLVDTTTP